MESGLSPSVFFDLNNFSHKGVFAHCEYVWQALNNIESYLRGLPLGKIESLHQDCAYLVNPELISIGEGTVIEPGAYIKGPCVIGKFCQIRHGAYIRGNVIVGDRCVVGHTTELKHAILLNHARAAHFAFIGDSILGNDVNIGAGVKCANLRLDGENIIIRYKEKSIATGLRKFGAIIGDSCQIGCNVVLNPGTLFGKSAQCYPSLTVGGVVESRKLVRPRENRIFVGDL